MPTPTDTAMPSFKRVMLATDFSEGSEAAFETALDLCKTLSARLSILHVFEYSDTMPLQKSGQTFEVFYQEAERALNQLLQTARQDGVRCDVGIAGGLAVTAILETAEAQGTDLLVLGTNAAHGLERLIFGSTAEAVLRKASCPVITVGPKVHKPSTHADRPIIFATDFHPATIHAVRYAASACSGTQSPLHCLTVMPMTRDAGAQSQIISQVTTEALRHLASSSGIVISPPVCKTIFGSDFPETVIQYAKKEHARLIVLGVQRAPAIASHGPRDATYRLIAEAPCPVLTVTAPQNQSEGDNTVEAEAVHQDLQAAWLKPRKRRVA
ncbi:MAG: universal stress protein [Edaphobacter sp.]